MTEDIPQVPAWAPRFLEALARSGNARQAAREAFVNRGCAYHRKRTNPEFSQAWDEALEQARQAPFEPREPLRIVTGSSAGNWRDRFFDALAESSNVTLSAAHVNVPLERVYKAKRDDPQFAARWLATLHEGYDLLEMELLGYLRDPRPTHKMDVNGAMKVLAGHRETVERRRAMMAEEGEDEQAMLESLDRFLSDMRQRRFANDAVLLEARVQDGAE
jgi:hypothetical protein